MYPSHFPPTFAAATAEVGRAVREAPYLVPRTSYLGPRTSYLGPRTSDLVPRTSYLVPRTSDLVPRTSGAHRRVARRGRGPKFQPDEMSSPLSGFHEIYQGCERVTLVYYGGKTTIYFKKHGASTDRPCAAQLAAARPRFQWCVGTNE